MHKLNSGNEELFTTKSFVLENISVLWQHHELVLRQSYKISIMEAMH